MKNGKALLLGAVPVLALGALAVHWRAGPVAVALARVPPVTPVAPAMAVPKENAHVERQPIIRWDGNELIVELDEMPLPRAIELLAQATHTTVASVQLLQSRAPLTLRGRFGDVPAAWARLLEGRAGHSLSCSAGACRLWLISETPVATRPAGTSAAAPEDAPRTATPEEEASQPGGAC